MSPSQIDKQVIQCSLPPHSGSFGFSNVEEFEIHYAKEHTNRCIECGRNLPSSHFLALHIDERHNPLREVLAAKGEKTYACFLPDCDRKCSTPQKRRLHMIDKHEFPKVYNFRVIDYGIDDAHSLLHDKRRRRVSVTNDQSHHQRTSSTSKPGGQSQLDTPGPTSPVTAKRFVTDETHLISNNATGEIPSSSTKLPSVPDDVEDLEQSFAALQFVPRSVLSKRPAKAA